MLALVLVLVEKQLFFRVTLRRALGREPALARAARGAPARPSSRTARNRTDGARRTSSSSSSGRQGLWRDSESDRDDRETAAMGEGRPNDGRTRPGSADRRGSGVRPLAPGARHGRGDGSRAAAAVDDGRTSADERLRYGASSIWTRALDAAVTVRLRHRAEHEPRDGATRGWPGPAPAFTASPRRFSARAESGPFARRRRATRGRAANRRGSSRSVPRHRRRRRRVGRRT